MCAPSRTRLAVFTTHMCIPMPLFSGHLSPTSSHFYPLLPSPIVPLAPKLSHFSLCLSLHHPSASFDTSPLLLLHLGLLYCYNLSASRPFYTNCLATPTSLCNKRTLPILQISSQPSFICLFCVYFCSEMDNFYLPFSATSTSTTSSFAIDLAQHYMGHPQSAHFSSSEPANFPSTPTPQLSFPSPYPLPYDQSLSFPHLHTLQLENQPLSHFPIYPIPMVQPMYSVSMGQSINPVPMEQSMYPVPMGQSMNPVPMQQSINPAPMGQNLFGMPYWQPQGLSQNEDITMAGAWMSKKIAREQRKLARQMSKSSASNQEERQPSGVVEANLQNTTIVNKHLYTFCTPDGTKLRELLIKTLKASDISHLGRIVLPKREAEENLPALGDKDKEGTQIELKDVYSDKVWSLKYKYWSNIKSRMYLLDNTGEFVKHYKLQIGDSVTLYEDELKNLYVVITKVQQPEVEEEAAEPSTSKEECEPNSTYNYQYLEQPYVSQAKDEEEEASLALLIQELNQNKQDANNLLNL